jgi:molecular chaperone DnaJ
MTNHYAILRVSKEASADQIKHAYRCLVKMYHPDLFPSGSAAQAVAGERIREINIAYSAVSQMLSRVKYQQATRATRKVNQPRAQTQPEPEHCNQCGKPTGYWKNVSRKSALCPACKGR